MCNQKNLANKYAKWKNMKKLAGTQEKEKNKTKLYGEFLEKWKKKKHGKLNSSHFPKCFTKITTSKKCQKD